MGKRMPKLRVVRNTDLTNPCLTNVRLVDQAFDREVRAAIREAVRVKGKECEYQDHVEGVGTPAASNAKAGAVGDSRLRQ
jgi:hypothetical protein